ncbi:MAG: ERAP1-like C-terminal domain-containing protein, partial [Terriglobales bacterium]
MLAEVAEQALTAQERVSLLNDEWALAHAGQHPIAQYMSLAQGMRDDHTRQVVQQIAERVEFMSDFLVEPADQNAFRAWVRNQFRPMLNEIGWNAKPGDSDDVKSVRATIIH